MLKALLLSFILSLQIYAQDFDLKEFVFEVNARQSRVEEFRYIRKVAKQLGIKNVYMFGGTAAAWAHYIRWDMRRELGIQDLQADRFDYDYTNIFRANQDFDIVIDGTIQQAEELESIIQEKFDYFSGTRATWEVRLLNETREDKDAILGEDFQNQHTDSHSTGLIDMMACDGFDCIKDVRDMKNPQSQFLMDVFEAKLHYYYSDKHKLTARYQNGLNPEILSVIRYFTKVVQYELEQRPSDLTQLKKIIKKFDPAESDSWKYYVDKWIEKNAKKLIVNAIDMEFAQNLITKIGLKEKLIQIGNVNTEDSMAWWINKEALKTKKIGVGEGKKASELFKPNKNGHIVVAHETNSFAAFESITKSHSGKPNVLISRNGVDGESAVHGDGHYTAVGTKGAAGTGLTIRYILNPDAREGHDFFYEKVHDFVIVQNKAALEVIFEDLNLGPVEYFEKLSNGVEFDFSDSGVLEKVKRRIRRMGSRLTDKQAHSIYKSVVAALPDTSFEKRNIPKPLISEWVRLGQNKYSSDFLVKFFDKMLNDELKDNLDYKVNAYEEILSKTKKPIFTDKNYDELMDLVYKKLPEYKRPYMVVKYLYSLVDLKPSDAKAISEILLTKTEDIINDKNIFKDIEVEEILEFLMSGSSGLEQSRIEAFIDSLIEFRVHKGLAEQVFSKKEYIEHPRFSEWMTNYIKSSDKQHDLRELTKSVLNIDEVMKHPDYLKWVDSIMKYGEDGLVVLVENLLGNEKFYEKSPSKFREIVKEFAVSGYDHKNDFVKVVLFNQAFMKDSEFGSLVTDFIIHRDISRINKIIFTNPVVIRQPSYTHWVREFIRDNIYLNDFAETILANKDVYSSVDNFNYFYSAYVSKARGRLLREPDEIGDVSRLFEFVLVNEDLINTIGERDYVRALSSAIDLDRDSGKFFIEFLEKDRELGNKILKTLKKNNYRSQKIEDALMYHPFLESGYDCDNYYQ